MDTFCISITVDFKKLIVFHNGHIQAVQRFGQLDDDIEDPLRFMKGAKFVVKLVDFEVYGRPLPNQELIDWTLCQIKEITSFFGIQIFKMTEHT